MPPHTQCLHTLNASTLLLQVAARTEGDLAICETVRAMGAMFAQMEKIEVRDDGDEDFRSLSFTEMWPSSASIWLKSEKEGAEEARQTKVRKCIQEVCQKRTYCVASMRCCHALLPCIVCLRHAFRPCV